MQIVSYEVSPAAELGVDEERLQDLRARVMRGVDQGPLPSVQLAVARQGRLVLFDTFGAATNTTRFNIYSCTKPLVAAGIWQLMGEDRIDIAQPVSQYLPAFADNGKQAVTGEQVLCHTRGFPNAPMGPPAWWTRQGRLEQMRNWHLEWEPGSRMVYHPTSAHWVLAELIEAITGLDYREHLSRAIIEPLGLRGLRLGVPPIKVIASLLIRNPDGVAARQHLIFAMQLKDMHARSANGDVVYPPDPAMVDV